MNKVYSVVWNRSLNQLVVASELATLGGKASAGAKKVSHSAGTPRIAGIMTALLAVGWIGWAPSAQAQANCAAPPYNQYNGSATCAGLLSQATAGGATALGYNAQSTALNATAVGYQAIASGVNSIYIARTHTS